VYLHACITFLVLLLQAQDKKAKDLLDQVTAKIKTYDNIVIDFKYTLNNSRENINQESKGNVVMKGNLFTLNLMGVTKLFDGKKTYTINPEDEEITISKYNEKDDNAVTPNKLLTFSIRATSSIGIFYRTLKGEKYNTSSSLLPTLKTKKRNPFGN
jgi:outer membrane lipoprotein-sorting protein